MGKGGGRVTHGSCHLSTSSHSCTSPVLPLAYMLHSAPPAAAAAAGASAWQPCLHPQLSLGLEQRGEGRRERPTWFSHITYSWEGGFTIEQQQRLPFLLLLHSFGPGHTPHFLQNWIDPCEGSSSVGEVAEEVDYNSRMGRQAE